MQGNRVSVPDHVVLPKSLTGIDSPIVVMFGDRFPMITAHKVLAAYSCLAPRVITGQFNPTTQRAVWPSTGNYARGGVAISRITGARGVAVLPAGMSQERFDWLDKWTSDPSDIIRTPGTESNVKEIYDACNEMQRDPKNFIFNQFCEFGNYLGHFEVTGAALASVYEHVARSMNNPNLRLAAFTSATGSAGTIGAGDRLKETYGTKIVAVEALECPTMLENGFGEHNIQGIGDKHIPLIHNVMNTDVIAAVSDRATDELDVLFNTDAGRDYLVNRKHVPKEIVDTLQHFGFSSICNVIAAIKTAKLLGLGSDDVLITIATDGADLYPSERVKTLARRFNNKFDEVEAAEIFAEHLGTVTTESMIDCTEQDRNRIFNLGYYTWVEQQGTPLSVFEARRSQTFWRNLRRYVPVWDALIDEFNSRVAQAKANAE
jgi:cysteine synthase